MAAAPTIRRHFATIADGRYGPRQVHYRRAGSGPVVVMFHQSPMSSHDFVGLMQQWSKDFTCIAPDTPGYGLSDPFGVERLEMDDIADAAIEFLDAIGVDRFACYGFHTGAAIAAAVADRYPDRVVAAVSNGYVLLPEPKRQEILEHYLPKFEPQWDGSHLVWLWSRLREQTIFFPWYRKDLASRMDYEPATPERLQDAVLEFLRSGDNYRVGYRAAFTFRGDLALERVQVPLLVTAAKPDPLFADLARIRRKGPHVEVRPGGDTFEATYGICREFLLSHPAPDAPAPAATAPLKGRLWQQMVDVPGGQLRVRRNTDAPGRTVLVQHDAASSSDQALPIASGFIGKRPVLAIDLPGHGESDNTIGTSDVTVARYADVALAAIDALGLAEFDFHGMWGGGLVGLELAQRVPQRLKHLMMSDVLWADDALRADLKANYTPAIEVNWYGGHLLHAWHLLRDQGLFWPWYRRTRAGILWQEPYVDPAMVHLRVTNLLKSPVMWRLAYQAHFDYPVRDRLAACKVPTLLCAPPWDPQFADTRRAADANPHCEHLVLPPAMTEWAQAFEAFLAR